MSTAFGISSSFILKNIFGVIQKCVLDTLHGHTSKKNTNKKHKTEDSEELSQEQEHDQDHNENTNSNDDENQENESGNDEDNNQEMRDFEQFTSSKKDVKGIDPANLYSFLKDSQCYLSLYPQR